MSALFGFGQKPVKKTTPKPAKVRRPDQRRSPAARVPVTCTTCARVFMVKPCRLERGHGGSCSLTCRNAMLRSFSLETTRVRIVKALETGGRTFAELATVARVTIPCATKHIREMAKEGTVEPRVRRDADGYVIRGTEWRLARSEAAE